MISSRMVTSRVREKIIWTPKKIYKNICNDIRLLREEFRQFLRILPEMLGFGSDRSSRVHTSTKIFGKLLAT